MAYNTKKIRHVCSVKGCSNRDVMLIAKNGHIGGVYLCRECAKAALDALTEKKSAKVKVEEAPEVVEEAKVEEVPKAKRRSMVIPKDGE